MSLILELSTLPKTRVPRRIPILPPMSKSPISNAVEGDRSGSLPRHVQKFQGKLRIITWLDSLNASAASLEQISTNNFRD